MKIRSGHMFLVLLLAAVVTTGCRSIFSETETEDGHVTLALDISVSDMPGSPLRSIHSKAEEDPYRPPVSDGEKMQTLRIIIVRPDKTVEHNRYISLDAAALEAGPAEFEVKGKELKKVYLIVNETVMRPDPTAAGESLVKVIDYDFSSLQPGTVFPESEVEELLVSLYDNIGELPLPLPMCECHEVYVSSRDQRAEMFVVRAAVKFTYEFYNYTSRPLELEEVTIDMLARREYFFPRNTVYDFSPDYDWETYEVLDYEVPSVGNNDYYTFEKKLEGKSIPGGTESVPGRLDLEPIYLLEGKYDYDASAVENYRMSATLDGAVCVSAFPNLDQLPRNTNVVVKISIRDHSMDWAVEVYPFGEYWLYPEFGQ